MCHIHKHTRALTLPADWPAVATLAKQITTGVTRNCVPALDNLRLDPPAATRLHQQQQALDIFRRGVFAVISASETRGSAYAYYSGDRRLQLSTGAQCGANE